jgi:UDP-glucose 4-epimerase
MMKCLVTGGLGYIGAHLAVELAINQGYDVTIVDDLSNGLVERNVLGLKFIKMDITDETAVSSLFSKSTFDIVFHLAAKKSVEESMINPGQYHLTNVFGTENLLKNSRLQGVKQFIFASTCAVYGEVSSHKEYVSESDNLSPVNVYGETKLLAEEAVKGYSDFFQICIFRFFNVVGSSNAKMIDSDSGSIVSNLLKSAKDGKSFRIFGQDYPTRDGTCIRDYIDVRDICNAMVRASTYLDLNRKISDTFNIGSENGSTVLEMFNEFSNQVNKEMHYEFDVKRSGDIPVILSDTSRIKTELNFYPAHTIKDSLSTISNLL